MSDIRPFAAIRPNPTHVERVASPPYDVLDSDEARLLAEGNPHSFLHVTKPEIDLPPDTSVYADAVYEMGKKNLERLLAENVLIREESPRFYVYRQRMGDHIQTGLVAGASVAEYNRDEIKKHEHTRPAKEDDRTRHVLTLRANTGPVFLTYPRSAAIDEIVEEVCSGEPVYDFVAADDIGHTVWIVEESETIDAIRRAFSAVNALYVADGHHRTAAAARVAETLNGQEPDAGPDAAHNFFLSVIFPDNQMKILDYNRVVHDLNGLDTDTFLDRVRESFEVTQTTEGKPTRRHTFRMCLGEDWYELDARADSFPADDPVASLDVSILQDNLLAPILGIEDPRTDERIDFVGGIRGTAELRKRVARDAAVAFALYPTSMAELMAIADAGEIMPPKSTWFEPKLRSGLLVKPL